MKKQFIIIILLAMTSITFAQQTASRFELKLGLGTSFLGTGDMQTLLIENELNYNINRYFSSSASIGFATSNRGVYEATSYTQGNVNIFFSPFTNTKRHDLRIGTGLSVYKVSDTWQSLVVIENGEVVVLEYSFEKRSSVGLNGIIAYSYALTDKLSLGAKVFLQPYKNGDINTGALLTLGVGL